MSGLLHIDLLQLIQSAGYLGVAGIIFVESGIPFGFFLPGGTLLFTAGLLAGTDIFNIYILVPLVIAAAIGGDNVGYWFGSRAGHALFKREDSRFFKKRHLEQAHKFFEHYGKRTIFFARFVPVIRTFAPILAGVGTMDYRTFFFYNTLGAVLWAGGFTVGGYFLGSVIPDAELYLLPIVLGIIVLSSVPLVIEWLRRHTPVSECPRAVIFDLDNTLARSFTPLSPEVARGLASLLERIPVAVMSGASIERMEEHLLPSLSGAALKNLYLFPDTCASCYTWDGSAWQRMYDRTFAPGEKERIVGILEEGMKETRIVEGAPQYSERIVARENQITFSGLGGAAPAEEKVKWDPERVKRKKLTRFLEPRLKGYDVRISSRTAIDITQTGVDKAMGVLWLAERLGVEPKDMLFVGDDLAPGGNDAMVIPTDVKTREVSGPDKTPKVIEELIATCNA